MLGKPPWPRRSPAHWRVTGADIDEFDLTDPEATSAFVKEAAPDLVINCAAFTDVDGCETRFDDAYRVNGTAVGHLARAARDAGAEMIHVSTDYVFDGEDAGERIEIDPVSPLGGYGRSKLAGERFLAANHDRWWIVRTQWLYGPGGKNFVDTILRAAGERDRLDVVDDQHGSPTYSLDLADQLIRIGERRPPYGIYHCSNKGHCTWFDFARKILELADVTGVTVAPMSSDKLDRPAKRPAWSILRNLHLEQTLGDTMRPWEDALAAYLDLKREG